MANDIEKLLSKLTVEDVVLDSMGRVIIRNPEIANAIRDLGKLPRASKAVEVDNWGCCKNGIGCGKALSDMTGIVE